VHGVAGAIEKKPARPTASRSVEITREHLASFFHMPSELACRELGIGLTVLKRQCRKYGILRWPFRKMKSLDNLIQRIADNERNNNALSVSGGTLKSVEELEDQKRKLEECAIVDLDGETKRMQQAFSKATHKQRLKQNLSAVRPRPTRVEAGGAKRKAVWAEPEEEDGPDMSEEEEERWTGAEGMDGKRARKPNRRYLSSSCPTQPPPPCAFSVPACNADLLAGLAEAAEVGLCTERLTPSRRAAVALSQPGGGCPDLLDPIPLHGGAAFRPASIDPIPTSVLRHFDELSVDISAAIADTLGKDALAKVLPQLQDVYAKFCVAVNGSFKL
jgi:RWP-RK domain